MTYLPRPGHPPTCPMMRDPVSDGIAAVALFFGAPAATATAIGVAGLNLIIGVGLSVAASRSVSILGIRS
jgi:hypothetical protein